MQGVYLHAVVQSLYELASESRAPSRAPRFHRHRHDRPLYRQALCPVIASWGTKRLRLIVRGEFQFKPLADLFSQLTLLDRPFPSQMSTTTDHNALRRLDLPVDPNDTQPPSGKCYM